MCWEDLKESKRPYCSPAIFLHSIAALLVLEGHATKFQCFATSVLSQTFCLCFIDGR